MLPLLGIAKSTVKFVRDLSFIPNGKDQFSLLIELT